MAQGFTQQEGLDYIGNFSLVANHTSVKLFLGLAAANIWSLNHMDFSNAFCMESSTRRFVCGCLKDTLLL